MAEQAFEFDDHEAWALTDLEVWATPAGESARLRLIRPEPTRPIYAEFGSAGAVEASCVSIASSTCS